MRDKLIRIARIYIVAGLPVPLDVLARLDAVGVDVSEFV